MVVAERGEVIDKLDVIRRFSGVLNDAIAHSRSKDDMLQELLVILTQRESIAFNTGVLYGSKNSAGIDGAGASKRSTAA